MKKPVFYTEAAYVVSLLLLAVGTALMEAGGFGISMVAAPAYVLHVKLSQYWPLFTFGLTEFGTQVLALAGMMLLVRRAKWSYLFTFATAMLYGRVLDGVMALVSLIPHEAMVTRIAMYLTGLVICSAAIGLILESYFPPAAYELFVKETSAKWGKPFKTVKTVYDLSSLALAVGLSFLLLGRLEGVGIGTVVGALVNGYLIHLFGGLYRRLFTFRDGFPWRGKFEESEERL